MVEVYIELNRYWPYPVATSTEHVFDISHDIYRTHYEHMVRNKSGWMSIYMKSGKGEDTTDLCCHRSNCEQYNILSSPRWGHVLFDCVVMRDRSKAVYRVPEWMQNLEYNYELYLLRTNENHDSCAVYMPVFWMRFYRIQYKWVELNCIWCDEYNSTFAWSRYQTQICLLLISWSADIMIVCRAWSLNYSWTPRTAWITNWIPRVSSIPCTTIH